MNTYTIFHNPRCSKSRQTLELLQQNGIHPEIVLYLEHPPSKQQLQDICTLLKKGPREITRTNEAIFKELNLAKQNLSDEEILDILIQYPTLIERPIVIKNKKEAILGRPPENVLQLIAA